jgi:hypothetical protein
MLDVSLGFDDQQNVPFKRLNGRRIVCTGDRLA